MKKKVLVGVLTAGLVLSSLGVFGLTHGVFLSKAASGTTTAPVQLPAVSEQKTDSNVQEPNYVGSIKVDEKAYASETDEATALQSLAKISQSDAEKAALVRVPGTVVKATIENENGNLVYSVEVKDATNKISDVKVDAGNGTVLTVESQDNEDGSVEKTGEESTAKPDTDTVQEESQLEGTN
jgi:uncharacterized membrane protein YkoI